MKRLASPMYLGFLICASVLMTWPLARGLDSFVVDRGDPLFASWALAWDCHALATHPADIFQANIFHPSRWSLAFSEHMIGEAAMIFPAWLCGVSPVALQNLALLLTFPLSGFCMFLLVRELTRSGSAAAIAGVLFAFSHYRLGHLSNVPLLNMEGLPVFLLGLHRSVTYGRWRDLLLAAAGFALVVLTCGYYAVMTVVVALVFAFWFLLRTRGRIAAQFIFRTLAVVSLLACVVLPLYWPYFKLQREQGFNRANEEIELYSADPGAYLATPAGNRILGSITAPLRHPEGTLFPGTLTLALAAFALLRRRGHAPASERWFYLLLALVAVWISFGPTIHLTPSLPAPSLYALLHRVLPGFDAMRVPARFGMIVSAALCVLAGFGSASLLDRVRERRISFAIAAAVIVLGLAEQWSAPMRFRSIAGIPGAADRWIAASPLPGAVVYLPVFDATRAHREAPRFVGSTAHWRPLVNGYGGFFPSDYRQTADFLNAFPSRMAVAKMQMLGVRFAVVDHRCYTPDQIRALRASLPPGAQIAVEFPGETIIEIQP